MKNNNKKMTVEEALEILENAQGKDFYTVEYQDALNVALKALREKTNTAHWIYSGDEDDYDGYYINCSKCGVQRKAYNRNCDLDVPVACPHCGASMDLAAWETAETVKEVYKHYRVSVVYQAGAVNRPYFVNVCAKNERDASDKALDDVAKTLNADEKMRKRMYVDLIEWIEER